MCHSENSSQGTGEMPILTVFTAENPSVSRVGEFANYKHTNLHNQHNFVCLVESLTLGQNDLLVNAKFLIIMIFAHEEMVLAKVVSNTSISTEHKRQKCHASWVNIISVAESTMLSIETNKDDNQVKN